MRLATYGTGDLTRLSEQQRAAGELRGEETLLESRLVATGHYALFNLARATLRPFALRIFVDFNAIGGNIEYFDISYFEWTQLTLKHYEESDAYRHFTSVVWQKTNDGYARTREEELSDQVRALTPPLPLEQATASTALCPTASLSQKALMTLLARRWRSSMRRRAASSRPSTRCQC